MKPEDVVNNALEVLGHKQRIASFWDGSREAVMARDMWSQTRDAHFTELRPEWAIWDDELTWYKAAPDWYDDVTPWTPAYPDMPWRYEYKLPALCLVPLAMKPRSPFLRVWRPRPMRFRVKISSGVYTVLGDDPAPVLTSVHSVHDPDLWDNPFVETVIATLAKKLASSLAQGAVQDTEKGRDADTHNR